MIETKGDVTIIRPTPSKWFTGAAIILFIGLLIPAAAWIFLLCALVFFGMASGKLTRMELNPQGLKSINLFRTRSYRWDDVEDFKIMSIRTSLFTSTKMLAFSRKDKKDSFMGKTARFFGGGTESAPITGIKPEELIVSINGYQARHMMFGQAHGQHRDFGASAPTTPPIPQQAKSPIGFGRAETGQASPAAQRANRPTAKPRPTPTTPVKPVFGRQSPSTPAPRAQKPTRALKSTTQRKSDSLVEEGGWLRKRRDKTSF